MPWHSLPDMTCARRSVSGRSVRRSVWEQSQHGLCRGSMIPSIPEIRRQLQNSSPAARCAQAHVRRACAVRVARRPVESAMDVAENARSVAVLRGVASLKRRGEAAPLEIANLAMARLLLAGRRFGIEVAGEPPRDRLPTEISRSCPLLEARRQVAYPQDWSSPRGVNHAAMARGSRARSSADPPHFPHEGQERRASLARPPGKGAKFCIAWPKRSRPRVARVRPRGREPGRACCGCRARAARLEGSP